MMPVLKGMISGESLLDGSVDLAFVALCNDMLMVAADNEDLIEQHRNRNG